MESSSQNGRRKLRPWTAQDQIVAEVAAACGVSLPNIQKALGHGKHRILARLNPLYAQKRKASDHLRYQSNREQILERARLWAKANRKVLLERKREWDKNNPEKRKEYNRRHRQACPEKARERARRWRINNIDKHRERNRRRDKLRRASRVFALQPASSDAIEARFSIWNSRCAFCGVNASHTRNCGANRLTEDHVMALTKGGLDEANNILPACLTCNSSKNNAPVETWYRCQPFFTETRWRKIKRHCPGAVAGQLPLALPARG